MYIAYKYLFSFFSLTFLYPSLLFSMLSFYLNIFIAKYSTFYVILFITIASLNIKQKIVMLHCVIAAVLILCRNAAPILQPHGLWTQMAIPRWWSGKSNCYLTFISQLLIFSYEIQLKSYVITYTDSSMNSFLFLILCLWMWSPTRFLVACYLCACLCIHVWVCEHESALYPRSEEGTWCPGDRMRPSFKLPNASARPATWFVCLSVKCS